MQGEAASVTDDVIRAVTKPEGSKKKQLPAYLERAYWWAYLRPGAVRFFDRLWLVNLILYGNFFRLRDAALNELPASGQARTLQVACVYGDFTNRLRERLDSGARLDVVDVAPIQLANTQRKLGRADNTFFHCQDSARLSFSSAQFDRVIVFFLLHEQPAEVRSATIDEALRVTRPGGKTVFVDYHKPGRWNPFRYLAALVFWLLEPFAAEFWSRDVADHASEERRGLRVKKRLFFGGLYQKTVFTRAAEKTS